MHKCPLVPRKCRNGSLQKQCAIPCPDFVEQATDIPASFLPYQHEKIAISFAARHKRLRGVIPRISKNLLYRQQLSSKPEGGYFDPVKHRSSCSRKLVNPLFPSGCNMASGDNVPFAFS
ncbi:predicted protein [Histoplasma capsulatum G186AR]|uniref:Uncharacterized protein n=1 Tax=Ajellomyces capsulatus (strain G186AR / H82 / ATCC MYA-2454 / RMSCC 2432) TaxID=447093 RepID=C0NQN6_AJECG|nr:uncharacterized protein HCBG_05316 [Histoplasma capsulatum G186AR]EEH06000.1 predicted protein [Histoplasma capsulatum G186AR]